jgi:hypothetical protein
MSLLNLADRVVVIKEALELSLTRKFKKAVVSRVSDLRTMKTRTRSGRYNADWTPMSAMTYRSPAELQHSVHHTTSHFGANGLKKSLDTRNMSYVPKYSCLRLVWVPRSWQARNRDDLGTSGRKRLCNPHSKAFHYIHATSGASRSWLTRTQLGGRVTMAVHNVEATSAERRARVSEHVMSTAKDKPSFSREMGGS